MSLNADKSTPLPTSTALNPSLPASKSSETPNPLLDEDFETAPLVGMSETPFHLMTEAQKREHVVALRNLRQNFQAFRSEVEQRSKAGKDTSPKPVKLDDMADILGL